MHRDDVRDRRGDQHPDERHVQHVPPREQPLVDAELRDALHAAQVRVHEEAPSLQPPGDLCVWLALPDGADLPTAKDSSGKVFVGIANDEYHCP